MRAMEERLAQIEGGSDLRLLGNNPIKDMIDFFSQKRGVTALDIYRRVLEDSLCIESSLQAVSVLENKTIRRFYGRAGEEPRFLSIKKHSTLVRLSNLLSENFVVLQVFPGRPGFCPIKLFDSRTADLVLNGRVPDTLPNVFCLAFDKEAGAHRTYIADRGILSVCPDGLDPTEGQFNAAANFEVEEPCRLKRLAALLGVGVEGPMSEEGPKSILNICTDSSRACRALGGRVVLLVYHLGGLPVEDNKKWSLASRHNPKRQTFRIVGVIRDSSGERIPWDEATVVAVTCTGRMYRVKEEHAELLIREKMAYAKKGGPEKILPRDVEEASSSSLSLPSEDDEDADRGQPPGRGGGNNKNKKKKKKKGKKSGRKGDKVGELSPCKCEACAEAEKWRYNLGPIGPQFLYKIPFDCYLYLKIFGLDTQANREALDQCMRLSCCSMDIESCTVDLGAASLRRGRALDPRLSRRPPSSCSSSSSGGEGDGEPARKKRRRRPRRMSSSSSSDFTLRSEDEDHGYSAEEEEEDQQPKVPFEPVSSVPRGDPSGEPVPYLQRPVVIGHMDHLEEPPQPAYFEVRGGLEGVQDTVQEYLNHLLDVREATRAKKEELLKPLLRFCEEYQETHMDFFGRQQVEDKVADGVWKRTLLGLFQKELERVTSNLFIFTFNGSGEVIALF